MFHFHSGLALLGGGHWELLTVHYHSAPVLPPIHHPGHQAVPLPVLESEPGSGHVQGRWCELGWRMRTGGHLGFVGVEVGLGWL